MPSPIILSALIVAALMALPVIAGSMATIFPAKRRAPQAGATEEGASSDDFDPSQDALMALKDALGPVGRGKESPDINLDHCVERPAWERFRNQPIRRGRK